MKVLSAVLILFLVFSCKDDKPIPKVIYDLNPKNKSVSNKEDTTQILVADLPIQFSETNVLLFPVGKLLANNYNNNNYISKGESSDYGSFIVSNANDNVISGFLTNLKFQDIGQDSIKSLTNQKIFIQNITYLKDFAQKTKRNLLVYTLEDEDTNKDNEINEKDINTLYISYLNGNGFTKLTKDLHELIDWKFVPSTNNLYFRSIEDTNKNGKLDKGDVIHYNIVNLMNKDWKVENYYPLDQKKL